MKNIDTDEYFQSASDLYSTLSEILNNELSYKASDFKIKVGASALCTLIANYCFSMIEKDHPKEALDLLNNIFQHAVIILTSKYPQAKQ